MFDSHRDHHQASLMSKVLKDNLKLAPEKPGVYKMISAKNVILYIGKAKNIKKRLSQYLQALPNRLQSMISQIAQVEMITTNNEMEALILEARLIKELQPKYNIILKDDKSFPYIMITDHQFPRLMKYRGKYQKGCYGPFPSTDKLHETISLLHKAFLLRSCSDSNFAKRQRPCLEYQIKRCSAPCVNKISQSEYRQSITQATAVLKGKQHKVQNELTALMEDSSKKFEYEKAAIYRDRIRSLQYLQLQQQTLEEGDVIGVYQNGNIAHIQLLSFSNNTLQDQCFYTMNNLDYSTTEEMMDAFILRFYQSNIAKYVFSNYQPSAIAIKALEDRFAQKIYFQSLQKGEKFKILQAACNNAQQHFQHNSLPYCFAAIREVFSLNDTPQRIEVYDNSHTAGSNPVGVMVVIDAEHGFNKKEYRHFNISKSTADDYFMMKEVLNRRIAKGCLPDFILIDGGEGHMSVIKDIVKDIPFACISKGKFRNAGNEQFHIPDKKPFRLEKDDTLLYFLQRIRDEAHRFAISKHRIQRNATVYKSFLDSMPGIGKLRKKLLLTHFGSVQNIKQASVDQLINVPGINIKIAQTIMNSLKDIH